MRRKRLQHIADTVCDILCGWRLANSYDELAKIGSGELTIDLVDGSCTFNERPIAQLNIAAELQAWMRNELIRHNISESDLSLRVLRARLDLKTTDHQDRVMAVKHYDASGNEVRKGIFFRLRIACESRIETDEASYSAQRTATEEWPCEDQ